MDPRNPIDAVTHCDPYPYYARLLARPPLHYDAELKLWVACRASTVSEILAHPACRVRPMAEPVPDLIIGSPAGDIFGALVRMNDGARHDQAKLALERALASVPRTIVDARARYLARRSIPAAGNASALSKWMLDIAVTVVADLLGFADDALPTLAAWTREFVVCMSPQSTSEQVAAAGAAASHLRSRMQFLLQTTQPTSGSMLARVRTHAESVGWTDGTAIIANLVGLLSQTHDAASGLIGNAIIVLATHPRLIDKVRARADGWDQLICETSRYDSPVQNTRRYIAERTRLAGVDLEPGSVVLLVLAAANRDPSANPYPQEFRLDRANRCVFTFSRGPHACPAEALARTIAAAAVEMLFESLPADWLTRVTWSWRPSANGRLPDFQFIV